MNNTDIIRVIDALIDEFMRLPPMSAAEEIEMAKVIVDLQDEKIWMEA